jgi:hypothetical protein
MTPLGAKLWPLLEVKTTRVEFGWPVLAAFLREGRSNLVKTKCPTTLVP